ncbi:MAG: hypothetical protein HYS13_12090 [Planctomycetia bacterium]|nr:hypothetical protein [Planctomycetia bacterium]
MNRRKQITAPDCDVARVAEALREYQKSHTRAKVDVYRHNSVSIRIRIVDPDFEGLDRVDRDDEVWKILAKLPDEVQSQITFVLALTPKETKKSIANIDFENPIPSRL